MNSKRHARLRAHQADKLERAILTALRGIARTRHRAILGHSHRPSFRTLNHIKNYPPRMLIAPAWPFEYAPRMLIAPAWPFEYAPTRAWLNGDRYLK